MRNIYEGEIHHAKHIMASTIQTCDSLFLEFHTVMFAVNNMNSLIDRVTASQR